jgi:hypothetical protein
MRFATLFFYAAASFFLRVMAIATGGVAVLQTIFAPETVVVGGSPEPWKTIFYALVIAIPLVFVALAVAAVFVRPADAPLTKRDLLDVSGEIDRSAEREALAVDPDAPYRRSARTTQTDAPSR